MMKRWQYIVGYLILIVAFLFAIWRIEGIANQNKATLCAQKTNAQAQVAASRKFLREHPAGINGISRADIEASLKRQEAFLSTFDKVDCN